MDPLAAAPGAAAAGPPAPFGAATSSASESARAKPTGALRSIPIGVFDPVYDKLTLGSALSGAAPSLPWLLAGRTFQGLGGAAIMAIQPALVRAIYPRNELGRGLGFNTTVVATSLAAGPSIGAALLSITSWPILFAAYVPLGIISFILSERYLPHTTHTRRPQTYQG